MLDSCLLHLLERSYRIMETQRGGIVEDGVGCLGVNRGAGVGGGRIGEVRSI